MVFEVVVSTFFHVSVAVVLMWVVARDEKREAQRQVRICQTQLG